MRSRALILGTITIAWVVSLLLLGGIEAAAYLTPVLAIIVPLLFGVFVGEQRLLARCREEPARRPAAAFVLPRRPDLSAVRGGLLIAASLAERPPPAASCT